MRCSASEWRVQGNGSRGAMACTVVRHGRACRGLWGPAGTIYGTVQPVTLTPAAISPPALPHPPTGRRVAAAGVLGARRPAPPHTHTRILQARGHNRRGGSGAHGRHGSDRPHKRQWRRHRPCRPHDGRELRPAQRLGRAGRERDWRRGWGQGAAAAAIGVGIRGSGGLPAGSRGRGGGVGGRRPRPCLAAVLPRPGAPAPLRQRIQHWLRPSHHVQRRSQR